MSDPGTAVAVWDPNSGAPLPAYLAEAMGELGTNIPERQTVPSLSYEGKVWQVVKGGNKEKLQAQNGDGDLVPIPIMRVIILMFNADRGRAFYEGAYNPAAASAPKCWSPDGKAPDPSVAEKQSPACQGCPMSIKGSKIDGDRELVACSQHRMLAVTHPSDILADPLRLKIAVTSDYDKEVVEHGWFALRQYCDFLKARGITHTGIVVTKIKFDATVAHPKLLFALDRLLTPDEIRQSQEAIRNPKVGELLAEKWTPAGVNGTLKDQSDMAPQPDLQTTDPVRPKPDSAGHIANAGTDNELWWDGAAWVKPWPTQAAAPPPPPPPPAPEPEAPPSVPKPTDPAHIAHGGTPNEVWWNGAEWVKPWVAVDPAPAAPPPPPAPEPEPAPPHDPIAAARADGWIAHPEAPGHHYKGQEVLTDEALAAKYPPASGGTGASGAPAATPESGAASPSDTGQAATSGASPSDGNVPADVQNLLDKWTS